MGQFLLVLVAALTVAAIVFGVAVLATGGDGGLAAAEPDDRSVPLPGHRPLLERDVTDVRFDTAVRGYRMAQVDQALRRAAYDIGYKGELIGVLEAEVTALREGRTADAEALRQARLAAVAQTAAPTPTDADPGTATGTDSVTLTDDGPVTVTDTEPVGGKTTEPVEPVTGEPTDPTAAGPDEPADLRDDRTEPADAVGRTERA
ncbi:DivIVA domain-containing protein [Micromonospora zhanjiangensis]